ncbi:hypothetical protein F8A86_09900 [Betaproteobacteria bacterium SCN1]|jgi:hypothetical protein|nr:hypothetical protein F8A86_09900 [Betaproteobacteria bacterium SCN1]
MSDILARLTRDQWAWEFLRRNPDYRADYGRFIALWRALEADYGAPPNRDFSRWKQDPRAYGPLPGTDAPLAFTGERCTLDDDRVLLECWMGAKWGFYKFPLDPACDAPAPDALSWRPPPADRDIDAATRVDIAFDLSLPLPPQLEAAKFKLVSRTADLRRQGHAVPRSVANQRAHWTALLRQLDGLDSPEPALLQAARAMVAGGYRDILRLADTATDQN